MTPELSKPALLGLLVFLQAPLASNVSAIHFRYQRAVKLSSGPIASQACAVLDADVFAHSAPSLRDLRLYSGRVEIPYATTVSEPLQQDSEDARILNLRGRSGHISFDLQMPHRPYTDVSLDIAARDYIANAVVSGSTALSSSHVTQLGTFTLFDLTSQNLSHVSEIPLSESTFPYLHLDLTFSPAPGEASVPDPRDLSSIIKAVTVPPSREAQSLYTTIQRVKAVQRGQESVATFTAQTRVPIERVAFTLPSDNKASFSRRVRILAREDYQQRANPPSGAQALNVESATGSIFRVHQSEAGHQLSAESLDIPVVIGSNMQESAVIEVKVENSPDVPLPLTVALQMRQRRICFDSNDVAAPLVLYYGDPSLEAPIYTDAALEHASANPRIAELGPETENTAFISSPPSQKLNQHRPILRWIALLGCVCTFALLVFRRSAHSNSS